jgi:zona occludens toxin (predicted ATPase)
MGKPASGRLQDVQIVQATPRDLGALPVGDKDFQVGSQRYRDLVLERFLDV